MPKVIDSFLFFQELDLLDIRLSYLDPYVDKFVIVEAAQTFTGRSKPFCFEENIERYSKYAGKIHYHKITDSHGSFESVAEYLRGKATHGHAKILRILEEHRHYPKKELRWVLDTYHRERIHLALEEVANPKDIVILSDLDEIPSERIFTSMNLSELGEQPRVCQQHEFRYFLNFYKDSEWFGSILSRFENIEKRSLNTLRIDSKKKREVVGKEAISPGGYHFTSCGSSEEIVAKIQSWAHQEFNNKSVLENLEFNIRTGQDIFGRELGTSLVKVSLADQRYFDERMAGLVGDHPEMICDTEIVEVERDLLYSYAWKVKKAIEKIFRKLSGKY